MKSSGIHPHNLVLEDKLQWAKKINEGIEAKGWQEIKKVKYALLPGE